MKMSELEEQGPRAPLRTVVLPPSVFSDEWDQRPTVEVCIGLRLISQSATDEARKEAEREAVGFYAQLRGMPLPSDPIVAVDVHNDALMVKAVARGTCDPNDVSVPYWRCPEDMVRIALTPEGVRRIYDEIVILHATTSPGRKAADNDDVAELARVLSDAPALDDESLKLISYLLDHIGAPAAPEVLGDDDDSPTVLAVGHA